VGAAYEIRINTDLSVRLAVLGAGQWSAFRAMRVNNNIGLLELTLPHGAVDPNVLRRDYIISVLRSLDGGQPTLLHDQNYLIRRVQFSSTGRERLVQITAVDWNDLLRRRIIAYYAGSAQTTKTAAADNMMKALVREALGAGASDYAGNTARALLASRFTVAPDLSLAPSLAKGMAWREPLLDVLRDIADASATAGTWLGFDVVGGVGTPPQFRTYIGQRGVDRRDQMPALSEETGTLTNPVLTYDWMDEKTAVYAGGRGEQEDRIIQTAIDATRIGQSYWGRDEAFVYASSGETDAAVLSEARAKLSAAAPRLRFEADFTDSQGVQYGRDVGFGDQVYASAFGRTFSCRINTVDLQVSATGEEHVGIGLRSERVL
jgi:hypothetical protein